MTVAIIPARGGSKRIPRKNVQPVGGVPLVVRAIDRCRKAGVFDSIAVSTDDAEIADLSARAGAVVVDRPAHLSGDDSTSEEAVLHALEVLGIRCGIVAMVQCTTPFTRSVEIQRCIESVRAYGGSAFTACPCRLDILWDRHVPGSEARVSRARDGWRENGGCFAFLAGDIVSHGTRFVPLQRIVEARSWLDIDTPEDLLVAQLLADHQSAMEREVIEACTIQPK